MSSRSSSSGPGRFLRIGRITGLRGPTGEITVRVPSGEASRWTGLSGVVIGPPSGGEATGLKVQSARAYRDRLVLKLEGVDDPSKAAGLKGSEVRVPADQVPRLPEGVHYAAWLVGLTVRDEKGERIGVVLDVAGTGGQDLLVVEAEGGEELLIPMAEAIVSEIDESEGRITVRLPDGLRELNRSEGVRH